MLEILLTSSISFIITFLAIPVVLDIAEQKRLFDVPDERKVHTHTVTSLGGVGIFGGFLLAALLSIQSQFNAEFQYFFAAAIVIFFLGLKDDLVVLSASKKFFGQIIAASILIHLGGIRLDSMFGFLSFNELPQAFSLALSYLTIIVVINSFNLIDGVDGLASSLGILTMTVFGAYFLVSGYQAYALMSFAMAGSLAAFLIFNHNPAKIFMGDSGSLMIGLINAILVIKFINVVGDPIALVPLGAGPALGIAILSVPLIDTLRVFAIRILNGRSPFTPDRNHIHHLLLDYGFSHTSVTLICVALNISFILYAYIARPLGTNLILAGMAAISVIGFSLLYYKRPKSTLFVAKEDGIKTAKLKTKPRIASFTKNIAVSKN